MDNEKEEEILGLLKAIKDSPAMNGAFENLVSSVNDIKTNQGEMRGDVNVIIMKQKEHDKTLSEMHHALYDPDKGVYKRVNDVRTEADDHVETCDELHEKHTEKQEELDSRVDSHDVRIALAEESDKDLKDIAGNSFQHLDSAISLNKNGKKLFWGFILVALSLLLKELWPWLTTLL